MDQKQKEVSNRELLEKRPGIFIIGSPNVGKHTLLSRLLSLDFNDATESSSDLLAYGWTINSKYYTADVSLWMTHLRDGFSIANLPMYDRLAALVMVFDMSDLSSFDALKKWVSHTDIQKFDILLCIGNKVDLVVGHPDHTENRRLLRKFEESASPELDYGIFETEGSSLLGDEEPSLEIRRSCMEWCIEHNIEYIEACASSAVFDKCLSVDGDSQGVERFYGALSAHMWPGMVLKSDNKTNESSLPKPEEFSEEKSDSDFELVCEILSVGSADSWDDTEGSWISANDPFGTSGTSGATDAKVESESGGDEQQALVSSSHSNEEIEEEVIDNGSLLDEIAMRDKLDELQQLLNEIRNMRDILRLLPYDQRRDIAEKVTKKVAAVFGDSSEEDEEEEELAMLFYPRLFYGLDPR